MHHVIHACQHIEEIDDDILHPLWNNLKHTQQSPPLSFISTHWSSPVVLHKLPLTSCFFPSFLSMFTSCFDINGKGCMKHPFHWWYLHLIYLPLTSALLLHHLFHYIGSPNNELTCYIISSITQDPPDNAHSCCIMFSNWVRIYCETFFLCQPLVVLSSFPVNAFLSWIGSLFMLILHSCEIWTKLWHCKHSIYCLKNGENGL